MIEKRKTIKVIMVGQICKFEFKGKVIFSKPFNLEENLNKIREKINKKMNCQYSFLTKDGKFIEQKDEEKYKLGQIKDGETIKLKEIELSQANTNGQKINVLFEGKSVYTINCNNETNLNEARKLIANSLKQDFQFIDSDSNLIDMEDEEDFTIENILTDSSISIKMESTSEDLPAPKNEDVTNSNKPKSSNKKKIQDCSKFEIIKKRKDLTIYKYSNVKRESNHVLVYQYFFDSFQASDYESAYVVLFCGKTGDGKSTALNAFFNIIKGIELEDNYRFILITEPPKAKGQAESQTDGVHLYYLKDYNNKPIILIDSQGYGDTRGISYDQKINSAFEYVFSNVISHINTVCFIAKANTNRLDVVTRYIFSSVTSLFSGDITENFVIVPTFASKDTINEGPAFVESIKTDADFLRLEDRKDQWWFALDSKSVLDNEADKITKYSFEQMKILYEKKIKKLPSKEIKNSAEVMKSRLSLRPKLDLLNETFKNLMMEQGNLQIKIKDLADISIKISDMENRIKMFESDADNLKPEELERRMKELNEVLNDRLSSLCNETEEKFINSCEFDKDGDYYTHCDKCEMNCHSICDCHFRFAGRCKIYTFGIIGEKKCEVCHCPKTCHRNDQYHWIKKRICIKKDNSSQIEEERRRNESEKQRYLNELNVKKSNKNKINSQIAELNFNKKKLEEKKMKNIEEKKEIEIKIVNTSNNIAYIIMQLKNTSDKIEMLAMNKNNVKNEDEYIESLRVQMEEIGYKDDEQREEINRMKKQNKIISEMKKNKNLTEKEIAEMLGVKNIDLESQ